MCCRNMRKTADSKFFTGWWYRASWKQHLCLAYTRVHITRTDIATEERKQVKTPNVMQT